MNDNLQDSIANGVKVYTGILKFSFVLALVIGAISLLPFAILLYSLTGHTVVWPH